MTTQTEYQELHKLRNELQKADKLKEQIKKCDERIAEESERSVPDFEAPRNYEIAVGEVNGNYKDIIAAIYGIIAAIVGIYGIISPLFVCENKDYAFGYTVVAAVGVLITLIAPLGFVYSDEGKDSGWRTSFICNLAFAVLALESLLAQYYHISSDNPDPIMAAHCGNYVKLLLICGAVSFVISLIVCLFRIKPNSQKLKNAKLLDEKEGAENEKKRNELVGALNNEVIANIGAIAEEKKSYTNQLKAVEKEIREMRILSAQDKTLYTVNTLINYFDRGRASSIKEAINLFVQEQRLDQMDREARFARMEAQRKQDAAIRKMAEEQEYHNEQMRKIARENSKKIDEAIDDIKNGR